MASMRTEWSARQMLEQPRYRFSAGVDMPFELLGVDVGGAAGLGAGQGRRERSIEIS